MSAAPTKPSRVIFFGLSPVELDTRLVELGLPRFRGQQLRDWVYGKGVTDVAAMTNLSARDRATLAEAFDFEPGQVVRQQRSEDGTLKLLLEWKRDGWPEPATTETVMIPDADRRTACVSSQVGCPVQCKFCASGMAGLKGSLDAGEIVYQVYALNRELAKSTGDRITNIVFMGMGEPMANYAAVMSAIRVLHDPKCFNLGARRITVSTVGVPKRIRELAHEDLPLNLALSLHAPNEPLRKQLIPWADHFELSEILDACQYYFEQSGREITLEYILLQGVNDRPEHARELAKLCRTMRANVNLIRYNEVSGVPFLRPKSNDVLDFQAILRNAGVNTHVRKSRGRDIDAACGQLKRRAELELIQLGSKPRSNPDDKPAVSPPGEGRTADPPSNEPASDLSSVTSGDSGGGGPRIDRRAAPPVARPGFTLSEMLVVLLIFVLLGATFVPYLLNVREQARRTACAAQLRQLRDAFEKYTSQNNRYYPAVPFHVDPGRSADEPFWTAFAQALPRSTTAPATATTTDTGNPNNVTDSLALLSGRGHVGDLSLFVCPSTGRSALRGERIVGFPDADELTYGYAIPFAYDPAGYTLHADRLPSRFVVMADRGPSNAVYADRAALPDWKAPALKLRKLNSPNHGGAGQNVLYADGSVRFVTTPYCGVGFKDASPLEPGDNIYTVVSQTPLLEVSPHDAPGFVGQNEMPAYRYDSYLVPPAP